MQAHRVTSRAKQFAEIVDRVRADRILNHASHQSLARMLPYAVERVLDSGTTLYQAGSPALELYLLLEGEINLIGGGGKSHSPLEHWIGQEAAIDLPYYFTDAVANTPIRILAISRTGLRILFSTNPELKNDFYVSLLESFGGESIHDQIKSEPAVETDNLSSHSLRTLIGWALAIILPGIVLFFGADFLDLTRNGLYFSAIFTATLIMWIFQLTDEYIPGIFCLLITLAMGLVPSEIALGGLASEGFILAVGVLGLGIVFTNSNLGYRFLLLLLERFPDRPFWHNTALLLTGLLFTPLIPSIHGRMVILTPLMRDMMEMARCIPKGIGATALAVSTFTGTVLLTPVFLSGQAVNFIVLGLIAEQVQSQYDWLYWIYGTLALAASMLFLHIVMALLMFRGSDDFSLPKEKITAQLFLLGELQRPEWAAILGVLFIIGALVTAFFHKIQLAWIGLGIFYGLLLFGMLEKKELRREIDWQFPIYVASILGITMTIHYLNLDIILINKFTWLGEYLRFDFGLSLLVLAVIVAIMRLVLPMNATIIILLIFLMPLVDQVGINSWIVGMSILVLSQIWFLPRQCPYYLQFREMTRSAGLYDEKKFLYFNYFANLIKIVALYLSIFYWNALGLL